MLREKQKLPIKGLFPIVLMSFFFNFAYTIASPVYPLFVRTLITKDAYVGYFAACLAFLMIIYSFAVIPLIKRYKKITLLKFGLLGLAITFISLAFIKNIYTLLLLELFREFFLTAVIISTALLLREIANKKNIGKTEGVYFTIANLAWMIGPLLGGLLAQAYDYRIVFIICGIFPFLSFIIITYLKLEEHNHNHANDTESKILRNIKDFFTNRSFFLLFLMSIGLFFWWSMIYTFLPLFIKDVGFSVETVGIVLFLVVVPLIFLEVPAGHFADRFGFKKFFFAGFFIMALLAISSYFVGSSVLVIALLILGSIGAAFVEPLREAYFFEVVSKKDEIRLYSVHRISVPVGQLLGPIIFSTVLLLSNFRFLFLFLGMLMLFFSLVALLIKDVKS